MIVLLSRLSLLRRPVAGVAATCLLAGLLAACGGESDASPPPASPTATTTARASAAAVPQKAAALTADPLTGSVKVPQTSVVALKIDNSPLARPYHRGLEHAALIYEELMEGGASRFLGVFAPAVDVEVGPIRSVRETDLQLLRQFGKVALGGSGGNDGVLASFALAAKQGRILDANFEVLPGPYRRAEKRRDAYNFFTSPQKIDRARPGGAKVRDIGLRFGPLAAGVGTPAARASVRFSQITQVTAQYEPATGRYAVYQDGDRMRDFAPSNVVVQSVQVTMSQYVDVVGNRTPYTTTIGTGPVTVLRDGRQVAGTWRRPVATTGTSYLDAKGSALLLKPGPTLVLLVPAGRPLQVG